MTVGRLLLESKEGNSEEPIRENQPIVINNRRYEISHRGDDIYVFRFTALDNTLGETIIVPALIQRIKEGVKDSIFQDRDSKYIVDHIKRRLPKKPLKS